MIISLNDLIEICVEQTDGTIPVKELMEDYHLRWEDGLSYPANTVEISKNNKSITLGFKAENVLKGIDGDVE